ncbi:unnamed protein product, partial [Mesorhabditis belari]|uniref:DM domain-containing protein n=1 Tax=Mesorhabditis belari TaxID=2138241 RepID=A0AAF3EIU0_9BILA
MATLVYSPADLSRQIERNISVIKSVFEPDHVSYTKRIPNCQKCGQHGRKNRLKGHKRVCPFKDCTCPKCQVVSERQRLMADQIKIRRRQRKDTIISLTRESISATLSALGQLPNGNVNNLIYNKLKPSVGSTDSQESMTDPVLPKAYSPPIAPILTPTTADISSLIMSTATTIPSTLPIQEISKTTSMLDPLLLPLAAPIEPITTMSSILPTSPVTTPTFGFSDTLAMLSSLSLPLTSPNSTTNSSFQFPQMLSNEQLLQQILLSYQFLAQETIGNSEKHGGIDGKAAIREANNKNSIIDICSV